MAVKKKPTVAVWKFASCDGCQLSLLDMEDELLAIASAVEIAFFPEASRNMSEGPYDLSLVEGSITTPHDEHRIKEIRSQSTYVASIGACATAGGIQALRNFADVKEYANIVYASPEYLSVLEKSTPISKVIDVDFELYGCPISKSVLLEFLLSVVTGKSPRLPTGSVCLDCKSLGYNCLSVSGDKPCLGPVTRTGCDALCISYNRPCFGCFGPKEYANVSSLSKIYLEKGISSNELVRLYRTFNSDADANVAESVNLEKNGKKG